MAAIDGSSRSYLDFICPDKLDLNGFHLIPVIIFLSVACVVLFVTLMVVCGVFVCKCCGGRHPSGRVLMHPPAVFQVRPTTDQHQQAQYPAGHEK